MKTIQYLDPTGNAMVARVPSRGTEAIALGSQLIVEESQQAVFLRDGKALDTFGPGRHTLATMNLPFLAKILGTPFEGKSPFQAAVVFVSTKTFLDLKWGTKEPVAYRDKELATVPLRAFGKFAVRISDAQQFVNEIVGTQGVYTTDGVEAYFKDVIVDRLTDLLGENLESIFDLPKLYDEFAMGLEARVSEDFSKFGIDLVDLFLGAITPPVEVQKRIDERGGMEAVGDTNAHLEFNAAQAMGDAAKQSGGAAGAAGTDSAGAPQASPTAPPVPPAAPVDSGSSPASGTPAASAAADGATAAGVAVVAASGAKFCHQCGGTLPGGANFCPVCGTKVAG